MRLKIITCLMMLSVLLASCSNNNESSDNTLNINLGPQTKSIDPAISSTVIGSYYITHAFEGLTTIDKDGKMSGGAAESWEELDGGLRYIFHLRTNAKWSDGKNVTAEDFVYSWRRVVDPKTASDYGYQFASVKNAEKIIAGELPKEELGVKAIDDYTLEVVLERPTVYFLDLVGFTTFYPVRKDIIEQYADKWEVNAETYIGNGPFTTIEISPDDRIVMVKNTNYWNYKEVLPEKLNFIMMQNPTASVAGIKDGTLDFSKVVPTQDIPVLKEEGILQIKPLLGSYYYCFSTTNEILKDVRIRKALTLAIDRKYIVENVTKGGEVPTSAFVPYGVNDVDGEDFREKGGEFFDINDYAKNVEEAKRLLAEAGYPNGDGFPVLEFNTDSGLNVTIFEAVQQMWKENLGIDVQIVQEELAAFFSNRYSRLFTIVRGGWYADFNDPINFLDLFTTPAPLNFPTFSNKEYDEYLKVALTSSDKNARMDAMHKAEKILIDSYAIMPMYFNTEPLLVSEKLKGVYYNPLSIHRFTYAYKEK